MLEKKHKNDLLQHKIGLDLNHSICNYGLKILRVNTVKTRWKMITSSLSSFFLYMSSYPVTEFSCPVCAGAFHESKILVSDLASPLKSVGWEGTRV